MKRGSRRVWFVALSLAIALIAIVVAIGSLDLEPLARSQLKRVEAATGRALAIRGPLSVRLLPRPAIVAEDVAFANARWGTRPQMVEVGRVDAVLAFWPLLRGRVEVVRLDLHRPDLWLETDARGQGNWELQPRAAPSAQTDAPEPGPAAAIDIAALRIHDARVTWRARDPIVLQIAHATLEQDDTAARVSAQLVFRQVPLSVAGTTGALGAWLQRPAHWPVDLRASLDGAEARFDGAVNRAANPATAVGKITAHVSEATALSALAGRALELPLPAAMEAELDVNGEQFVLDPLLVNFAESALRGTVAVRTGSPRPFIRAQLSSDQLKFGSATYSNSGAAAGPPEPAGQPAAAFSTEPLPFEALRAVDGELALTAAQVLWLQGLPLSNVQLQARLDNGLLTAHVVDAGIAGGSAGLQADVRALDRGGGRVALRLTGLGVDLGTLLARGGNRWLVGGSTDLQTNLSMEGASAQQLAASTSGTVRLSMSAARIEARQAQWVGALLQALRPGTDALQLQCAAALLPFSGGIARVERGIAVESPQLNAVASGTIDLGERAIDLAVQPGAPPGVDARILQLGQVVRIHGPWRSPKVGIDAGRLVEQALMHALQRGSLLGDRLLAPPDPTPCLTVLQGRDAQTPSPTQNPQAPPIDVEQALRRLLRR